MFSMDCRGTTKYKKQLRLSTKRKKCRLHLALLTAKSQITMSLTNSKQERLKYTCIEHDRPGKTLRRGSVVWGKLGKNYKFWPGLLVEHEDCGMEHAGPLHRWVYWFGDHRISKVENCNIYDFDEHFDSLYKESGGQKYNDGIQRAKAVMMKRFNFKGFSESTSEEVEEDCDIDTSIPQDIVKDLAAIKLQNLKAINKKISKQEEEPDINVMEVECIGQSFTKDDNCSSDREGDISYPDFVSESSESETKQYVDKVSLKDGKFKLNNICICCQVLFERLQERFSHPIFVGLCCRECYMKMKECMFDIGEEDNVHIYCSICARPGETFICDNRKCSRVFCHECIEQYWNKQKINEIHRQSPWLCFLCTGDNTSDFLKIEVNWEENVMNLFKTSTYPVMEYDLTTKCKLRVLSLYDGLSAVLVALEELGLDLNRYIALEENPKAVRISLVNHGNKPYYINLGSIKEFNFNLSKDNYSPIHLLIGGFYKDLCLKKPAVNEDEEKNVDDAVIQFLNFYRMWTVVNRHQKGYPFLWLFVNDGDMKTRELITRYLECDPIVLNTGKYTSHCHYRSVWGNIPGLASNWIKSDPNVFPALTDEGNLVTPNKNDMVWISKIEELFGFSRFYTDIDNLNIHERQKLLGRSGNNVHIIKKMLQPLQHLFALKEKKPHN